MRRVIRRRNGDESRKDVSNKGNAPERIFLDTNEDDVKDTYRGHNDDCSDDGKEEKDKRMIVSLSDAIPDPNAMMIKSFHTVVADATMNRSWHPVHSTRPAILFD